MANERGAAVGGQNDAGGPAAPDDRDDGVVTLEFSLTKKAADKIGRVKRWEDRSRSKSLELTGRR